MVQRGSTSGKIGIIDDDLGPATINPSLMLLKYIKLSSKYLFYLLTSALTQKVINSYLATTAIPMISQEQIENLPIIHPEFKEQSEIVKHLDNKINNIDNIIKKIKNQNDRLCEYRTALISAAVTGKIDVQDEVGVVA